MTTEIIDPNKPQENRLSVLMKQKPIRDRFEEILGKRRPVFEASLLSAYNGSTSLKEAEPMSVIASAMIAATLDLPINQNLGFAHIVAYQGKAQFQMGYKGFVQLAMRTGQYKTMNYAAVYEGELKNHNRITGDIEIDPKGRTGDKVIGYVAYFRLISGFEKYLYMTVEEVTAHGKKYSASFKKNTGRWVEDFEAMALKTVIKLLLSKWGILSVEMQKALEVDQAVVEVIDGDIKYPDNADAKPEEKVPAQSGPARLRSIVKEGQTGPAQTGPNAGDAI